MSRLRSHENVASQSAADGGAVTSSMNRVSTLLGNIRAASLDASSPLLADAAGAERGRMGGVPLTAVRAVRVAVGPLDQPGLVRRSRPGGVPAGQPREACLRINWPTQPLWFLRRCQRHPTGPSMWRSIGWGFRPCCRHWRWTIRPSPCRGPHPISRTPDN